MPSPPTLTSSPGTPGGGASPGANAQPSADARYLADALMEALRQKPHARMYPYFLGVNRLGTTALTANQTVTEPVPVGGDAHFLAMGLIAQAQADFLVNLRWSHLSGSALTQTALHSKALFGSNWAPFAFARPQLMPHDATVSIELTNLAATPNAISLFLFGSKVVR